MSLRMIPKFKILLLSGVVGAVVAGLAAHAVTRLYYKHQIARIELSYADAITKAQQTVIAEIEAQKKIAKGVDNEYQTRIALIRATYAAELERLRASAKASRGGGAKSSDPGNCAGTPTADRLPWHVQEDLIRLMQQADEQTQRLISCQSWVRHNE